MGLEWHNRKRSIDGRFAKRQKTLAEEAGIEIAQLHIRVPADLAQRLRRMAIAEQAEIGEICADAIEAMVEDWETHNQPQT